MTTAPTSVRVLVDGYALGDGSAVRGIGTYLKRVVSGLSARPGMAVTVLAERDAAVPAGVPTVRVRRQAPRRFRHLEHDLRLSREIARQPADVFLSPAQEPPRRSAVPWVQTLHDLIPLTWPHPLHEHERRRWLRVGPRIRGADAIVAVSEFSAREGVARFGLDPGRIRVIHLGVDPAVFRPDGPAAAGPPYLLHVSAFGPHKGFAEAMAVIAALAEAGLPHRLRLVGPHDAWSLAQVRDLIAASPRPDRVEIAGYVADLPAAYRGATALLMTSRCEGFGLPALEAMACGTPVLAFANSSLPEVVGDGGVLIRDGDVPAMADQARRVIEQPALATELSGRGVARSQAFRWEKTVEAYAALLASIARRPS